MMELIFLLNYIAVNLFGSILSAAFCGIHKSDKQKKWLVLIVGITLTLQGIIYCLFGFQAVQFSYPVISHLPLIFVLWYVTKRGLCSLTAVLTGYLCCQLRRWAAIFIANFFENKELMFPVIQIIITLPLLLFLLRFVASAIREMIYRPAKDMWTFAVIPIVYYLFDYSTAVYTNLLYNGSYVVAEFMPTVCCAVYLIFINRIMVQEKSCHMLEQERNALKMQTKQSLQEIEFLRYSQEQAAAHRHDLRHHLQYLYSCMENGQTEQGQEYIQHVCHEIESHKMTIYCENETANLILGAYADRFMKAGIQSEIQFSIGKSPAISSVDLCVLMANALENALNECQYLLIQKIPVQVQVVGYEKEHKIFLQITNTCRADIFFQDGIPVTKREGHGIGTRSICAIVNKYQGIYSFSVKNENFILRVVL